MLRCCGFRTLREKAESRCVKSQQKKSPVDFLTKYVPGGKVAETSRALGFFVEGGRSDIVDAAYVSAV